MWALIRAGAALLLWCVVFVPSSAWAEKRVALIIGNGAYVNVPPLPNPPRDAAAMADMLRAAGFNSVKSKTDLGAEAMRSELRNFADEARDADIALIYYAGHGIEMNGVNYLIPIDAKMARDVDVEDEAISLDRMIRTLEAARGLQFVILDSCRDNPFVRSIKRTIASRSVRSGLGDIDEKALPPNTLIAYAQRAGLTAEDGAGANSPYTTALLKHLATPGLDVEFALRRVRDDVLKATNNRQEPFKYGSLGGSELPLVPRASAAPGEPPAPPPTALHLPESPAPEHSAATAPEQKRQADQEAGTCRRYLPSIGKTIEVPCERAQDAEKTGEVAGKNAIAAVAPIAPTETPGSKQAEAKGDVEEFGQHSVVVKVGEGNSKRGVLGVRIADLSEELAKAFGLSSARGAFVTEVLLNGAAAQSGIKPLDVVEEFDGRNVANSSGLAEIVGGTPPGTEARVVLWRFARSYQGLTEALNSRAESGDAAAANALGWLYRGGSGDIKNEVEAVHWYRKAAEQGHTGAMTQLASMYANGEGINKDETEAARWYRKAAEAGEPTAMAYLGFMYGSGSGVAKDDAEAARWYRKAAEAGEPLAMANLGLMYENGLGVAKDDAEAVRWYRKGAEAGNTAAMAYLGTMYVNGHGVAKDEAEGVRWYRKGAEAGEPTAMADLANMYERGRGVARDPATASQWMFKALQGGADWAYQQMTTNSSDWGKDFRSELQRRLKEAGVYDGPIDGEFGPSTQGALVTLKQRAN